MLKNVLFSAVLITVLGSALPHGVIAGTAVVGRLADVMPTSISVFDRERLTFAIDDRTRYTKWITQKPWQENSRLTSTALKRGRLVMIHPRRDDRTVADWVEIATDMR